MSGFMNVNINNVFQNQYYNRLKQFFLSCCDKLIEDFVNEKKPLPNRENEIRNILVEEYLRDSRVREEIKQELKIDKLLMHFELESPEKYNPKDFNYVGRTDIKVVNEDTLEHNDIYYTIECKRLDGNKTLNKEYVLKGVERFIGSDVKYPSSYKKNIMFGMVVKPIDIPDNTVKINQLLNENLSEYVISEFKNTEDAQPRYYIYEGEYIADESEITLDHIFYNFSTVII